MKHQPTPDIPDQIKQQVVIGLADVRDDLIESIHPYRLTDMTTHQDGSLRLRILVDEAGNHFHELRRSQLGTFTFETLRRPNPEHPIRNGNPPMIEPLKVMMRQAMHDAAIQRFGTANITLTNQCRHFGPYWIRELNAHAESLCTLALGDEEFRRAKGIINAEIRNITDHKILSTTLSIKKSIRPGIGHDDSDVTWGEYNTAATCGDSILKMLDQPEHQAYAVYFWKAVAPALWHQQDPKLPEEPAQIRTKVLERLKIEPPESLVFERTITDPERMSPQDVAQACRTLSGCHDAPAHNLQHAYEMDTSKLTSLDQWPQGDPAEAWRQTVTAMLDDPDTMPSQIQDVFKTFTHTVSEGQPWPTGNARSHIERIMTPIPEHSVSKRDEDGIEIWCAMPTTEMHGLLLKALTNAQDVKTAETATKTGLDGLWQSVRNHDAQAYAIWYTGRIIGVATIERSQRGWKPGQTVPARGRSLPPSTRAAVERTAVLYGAAERNARR